MTYRTRTPLRGGRVTDTQWRWLFIGIVLGFGVASVGCLILVTTGYITLNTEAGPPVTEIVSRDDTEPTVCGPVDAICGTPIAEALAAAGGVGQPSTTGQFTQVNTPETTQPESTHSPTAEVPADTPTPSNTPPPTSTPPPTKEPIDPRLAAIMTELVPVAGGTFQMGTNQQEAAGAVQECIDAGGACEIGMAQDSFPPHPVTITSFQIERYEVTVRQYAAFLNVMGPGSHTSGCGGRCINTASDDTTSPILYEGNSYTPRQYLEDRPMTNVTWFGADAYCRAIGRRLPTEAEWERAARGSEGYIYPWGWTFDSARANTNAAAIGGTTVVGSYPNGASPFGAEDMAGNVAEWVYDWYQVDFYSTDQARQLNPQGPSGGSERVIRGGAWDQRPFFSRTVHRLSRPPNEAQPWLGFRCVSDENPPPTVAPAGGAPAVASTPTLTPTLDPNITPSPLPTLPGGAG